MDTYITYQEALEVFGTQAAMARATGYSRATLANIRNHGVRSLQQHNVIIGAALSAGLAHKLPRPTQIGGDEWRLVASRKSEADAGQEVTR